MQVPASNLYPNFLHRFVGNSRTEIDEVLPRATLRPSRPKGVTEKIEFLVGISPSPIIILAIDDLRLLRMKFQPAFLQTCGYRCPNPLGFHFRCAMHDGIIGET